MWWSAQTPTNRLVIGAVGLTLILALGVFGAFRMRGPEYAVLFSNLQPDEANAVVQKLDSEKIPHRLADGGATVLVPRDNVYEERVQLAGEGVVKAGGSTGFELFDRTNLGMTDFQEKIAKTRATEGELQRTISGLTTVQSARVHIAMPEDSLFVETQRPTTASVAIATRPGMQLSPQEVRGITQLVAGAVEGLKPENVTIVDQNGTVLRPSALDGGVAGDGSALKHTQDQLLAKEKYESDLQESLQGLLDTTIGAHRSAVRVATQMNFDANSTETKSYAPQGTVLSEKTKRESLVGAGGRPGAIGIPGTTTNVVPTYQGTANNGGNTRYNNTEATRNYQVGEQNVKHVDAPGKVTRLSVAVLVNVPPPAANAAPNAAPYAVSAATVQKIRSAISAAAGIDPTRGDQVSVEAIPFAPDVAGSGRAIAGGTSSRARRPGRAVHRAARDPRAGRRRIRPCDAAPAHVQADGGAADLRLDARGRAALVRRASDAGRHAGDRRADTLGRRSDARADDRVRHLGRDREPRQHRKAGEIVACRVNSTTLLSAPLR